PERGALGAGGFTSPTGFVLAPPSSFAVQVSTLDPDVRVRFSSSVDHDLVVVVRVRDGLEAADAATRARLAELSTFEGFPSYKRLEGGTLTDGREGCWRHFTATQAGKPVEVLEVDVTDEHRSVALLCVAPPAKFETIRPEFEACGKSLRLTKRGGQ